MDSWLSGAYLSGVLVGITVGIVIALIALAIMYCKKPIGTLCIDQSDPEDKPYMFLELETDMETLASSKNIILRVKMKNYLDPQASSSK